MAAPACERCVDRFGEYADGVLASDDRAALEAHLRSCPECGQLYAEYRRAPEIARRATGGPMPANVRARLRRLLSRAWRGVQ